MKHLVLLPEPIHPDGIAVLAKDMDVLVLDTVEDPTFAEMLPHADGVVVRSIPFGPALVDQGQRLKVIGRHGAGLDNIDVAYAGRRGITVVNTPHSNTVSVAEYVITAILMLVKRMGELSAALADGRFAESDGSLPGQVTRHGLIGREIAGMQLGIVGFGAIGRAVAARAQALGMAVDAHDPYVTAGEFASLDVTRVDSLGELLERSDVLTVHVPGGQGALIGRDEIRRMRPGALLINTARGDVVDPEALVDAVNDGHLAGAVVDVFQPEPPDPRSPLLHTPGILCTPHMAAMTREALRRMAIDVAHAVRKVLCP